MDERERGLQKIATKGVLKLFNAVAEAQAGLNSETGPNRETKRTREMTKDNFLQMLKSGGQGEESTDGSAGEAADGEPKWDVLKEDYGMKHTSLKDWGDEEEDEDEMGGMDDLMEGGGDLDSDDDDEDEDEDEEEEEEEEEEESEEEDEME